MLNFKGFDFFPHGTRIDFMRFKDICFWTSVAMMVASLALFMTRGLNYGVDFKGGSALEVQAKSGKADAADLRARLGGLGIGDVQIQPFGNVADVLIRVEQQTGGEKEQTVAVKKVLDTIAKDYTLRKQDTVGPAVSAELRTTGIIAVLCSILAIIIYVWFRFEWQFALGGVMALAHDVLLTVGLFSLFQLEFDLSIVAALLTILGYSINDTVVVSDRIRENLRKYKRLNLTELLNLSINETLSRTILTGATTLAVLVCLYIWGGAVIRNFNLAMLFGVLVGTYSSIFIAAPLLDYLGIKRDVVVGSERAAAERP